MDEADYLRVCIIILSLTAPILIIIRNHGHRHTMSWGDVLTRVGIGVVFVAVAYSTAESFIAGLGLAPRLYVLLGALIWVNIGLLSSILHDRKLNRTRDVRAQEELPWP